MSETLSTLDMPVWRVGAGRESQHSADTQPPFSLGDDQLLFQEPIKGESDLEAKTADATYVVPTQKATAISLPAEVTVPRTQRVSTRVNDRYILLKKYEGFVMSRGENSFTARLFENQSDYPVLEAEFELEELSETDRELAVEGAPLVWTIGYGYAGSTRKRESAIYLRRLPPRSQKEISNSRQAASELTRAIQWE